MDGEKFELWLNRVLPKLPPGSVVVMDNASYHTKKVWFHSNFYMALTLVHFVKIFNPAKPGYLALID
jgi:hypothetical protein